MATLTQENGRLNQRLEKTPARQSGVVDRGQADSSGSAPSSQSRAATRSSQKTTAPPEGTMRVIKDIRRKHRNNRGLVPLRSNCKKVSKFISYH